MPKLKSTLAVTGTATTTAPEAQPPDAGQNPPAPLAPAVRIRLRVGNSPVPGRAALGAHTDGSGVLATNVAVDADGAEVDQEFAAAQPGDHEFTLSVPVRNLGLQGAGAYPVTVQCLDGQTGDLLAERTTSLAWLPFDETVPATPMVVLYPFSAPPAMGPDGQLIGRGLARQLASTGRLGQLLATAGKHSQVITWVEDPAIGEIITRMSAGTAGASTADQARGRQALTQLVAIEQAALGVAPTQYALDDVAALTRGRADALTEQSIRLAGTSLAARLSGSGSAGTTSAQQARSVIAWPAGLRANGKTVAALSRAGAAAVILDQDALPPAPDGTGVPNGAVALPTADGPLPALVMDAALSAAFSTNDAELGLAPSGAGAADQTGTELSQRFVSESLIVALGQGQSGAGGGAEANGAEAPSTVVVAPSARWAPDIRAVDRSLAAIEQARWLRPIPATTALASSLADPTASGRLPLEHTFALGALELPSSWISQASANNASLDLLQQILPDDSELLAEARNANLRSVSAAWRSSPEVGQQILTSTRDDVQSLQEQVRIVSAGTITLAQDQARIPVTIANDLAEPVRVRLHLEAQPASRLQTPPQSDVLTVAAGRKLSVEVPATVVGGGELPVNVQLETPDLAELGDPVTLTLRTTAYAQAAGRIVGLAFIALVVGLGVNFVRRRRQLNREGQPDQDGQEAQR